MAMDTKVLRSSVIDGIALVPRYQERQLSSLHRALVTAKDDLIQAAVNTLDYSYNEALAEFLQVLDAINAFHSTRNPEDCNAAEYATARSQDFPHRRTAYGYAFIVPTEESLYSTVIPLAAAMTAGNVVLLQRPLDATSVGTAISKVLVAALSAETFAYVDGDPFDSKFRQIYGVSFEGKLVTGTVPTLRRITCPAPSIAAVVDRSGDVQAAANALVRARFSFGGSSSYAPAWVLVNDFAIKEFSQAAVNAALQYSASLSQHQTMSHESDSRSLRGKAGAPSEHESLLMSGDHGRIILLSPGTTLPDCTKSNPATLFILPVTSMDAAIDILNQSDSPLAAHYVYADPASAKYITQFVRSAASFVNHVPTEILIGGLGPMEHQLSAHPRYTPEMFSQPSPIMINNSVLSTNIARLITASEAKERKQLEAPLTSVFKPVKEPWGPMFGFFEQGFLFNASLILTSVVIGTVCGVKYGYPALLQSL